MNCADDTPADIPGNPKTLRPVAMLRFRRGALHLHALGPRPLAEFLVEISQAHRIEDDVLTRLDLWRDLLSPETVEAAATGEFPPLLRVVRP